MEQAVLAGPVDRSARVGPVESSGKEKKYNIYLSPFSYLSWIERQKAERESVGRKVFYCQ